MMLMPDAPCARQDEAGEGIRQVRRKRRELPVVPQEEQVARTHLDRQRAAVEPALERLDLQRDAIEVDAVAAVDAGPAARRGPVEADARPEVVQVPAAIADKKRLHDRVDLVVAADVLDVGVQLVPQPKVDRQVRTHAPVVLDEEGRMRVVGIRDVQVLVGLAAPQRHGKQQVVVVHLAVAVVIEPREVLNQLHAAFTEHAESEAGIHELQLAAGADRVRTQLVAEGVGQLQALLHGRLRHAERRAVLDAGKRVLRARRQRDDRVVEVAVAQAEAVDAARGQDPASRCRAPSGTCCRRPDAGWPRRWAGRHRCWRRLRRSPRNSGTTPGRSGSTRQSRRARPSRSLSGAGANERRITCAVVSRVPTCRAPSWLRYSSAPNANRVPDFEWAANRRRILLTVKWRRVGAAVGRCRQRLQRVVAEKDRPGPVK